MLGRLSHTRLLRYAGLFTWACVGLPLLFVIDELPGRNDYLYWWVSYLAFGLAYWLVSRQLVRSRTTVFSLALLVVMSVTPATISHFSESGLGGALLLVSAGVLPWLIPPGLGLAWLIAQNLILVPVFAVREDFTILQAFLQVGLFFGYSSFTFVTSLVAKRQAEAHDELRRLNAELRATRALLAESSRLNERSRISRELHDLLGHHLTALSLNLEVATHLSDGKAREHIKQAQSLAKLLLSDVREAVSQLRDGGAIDLHEALAALAKGVPSLAVHLDLPERLSLNDPLRAQVILRCVQEVITNAVRHAGADNLWIRLIHRDGGIALNARDDGRGAEGAVAGNGLRGMRERLAEYDGRLSIAASGPRGFALDAFLPLEGNP